MALSAYGLETQAMFDFWMERLARECLLLHALGEAHPTPERTFAQQVHDWRTEWLRRLRNARAALAGAWEADEDY